MGKKDGGRTLNPADKLRKEQRAKEIKKNKEKRAQLRQAILTKKSKETLEAELAEALQLEKEGRADGKMLQKRKQIQLLLAEMNKEEQNKPQPTKSLEEMYPDAEGSIYYHPINNPYGVPPPGHLQMWKPGYIPKAERWRLPLHHPLHPEYKPHQIPSQALNEPIEDSIEESDENLDESSLSEEPEIDLDSIPPPPEEPDSDDQNEIPAPPQTESDIEMSSSEEEEDQSSQMVVDSNPIPARNAYPLFPGPPPITHTASIPPFLPNMPPGFPPGMPPVFPPGLPPGFPPGMPPPGMPPVFPPGPPPMFMPPNFAPGMAPPHPSFYKQPSAIPPKRPHESKNRKDRQPQGIPDPFDPGEPKKKEVKSNQPPSVPESRPAEVQKPQNVETPAPVNYGPTLLPAALRAKRNVAPGPSRPVAPRVQPSMAKQAQEVPKANEPKTGDEFEKFMQDMKQLGAIQ